MPDSATLGPQMVPSDQASVEADRMDIVEDGPYIKQRNTLVPPPIVNEQQPQVELFLPDTCQLYSSYRSLQQDVLVSTSGQHINMTTPDYYPATMTSLDKVLFQSELRSVSVKH